MIICPLCQEPVLVSPQFGEQKEMAEDDQIHSFACPTLITTPFGSQKHFFRRRALKGMQYVAIVAPFHFSWGDGLLQVETYRDILPHEREWRLIYEKEAPLEEFYQAIIKFPKLKAFL
jgi:hypothetical protein